ncbi:MAG: hypothetical protein MJ211_09195 [Bacteroidales bacterium]|nr:hypothetical protein [Bacteroidales bacterium]
MKHFCLILIFIFSISNCISGNYDTLQRDSLMFTTGPNVIFKGDNNIIVKNNKGEVIEGVLGEDTDLWTTGPMVSFASNSRVKFNNEGKVIEGFSNANFIALACDNKYYEFKSYSKITFDNKGTINEGNIVSSIKIICNRDIEIFSVPESKIKFYDTGEIMWIMPTENIKINTSNDKIVLSNQYPIKLNKNCEIIQGCLAKKTTFVNEKGEESILRQGSTIFLGQDGKWSDNN